MRVTLVRPPYYSLYGITMPSYPIGLGFLSSYIRENGGHKTVLVDGETGRFGLYKGFYETGIIANVKMFFSHTRFFRNNQDKMISVMSDVDHFVWHYVAQEIIDSKPEVVGFNCYTTNVESVNSIANIVKRKLPDVPIVVGGPHVNALPESTLAHVKSADYAIYGEGEITLGKLLEAIENGKPNVKEIDGIVFRQNKTILKNKPRSFVEDINTFPLPDRLLGNRGDYRYDDYILTNRGCPFQCTFCTVSGTWSRQVRFRSVEKVIQEIQYLKDNFGTQRVTFLDDTFTLNKRRVMELCKAIIDNRLNGIEYSATSRADTLDEEKVKIMVAAGFKTVRFGIESGSPRIQKLIKKNIKIEQAIFALDLCNKYKIDSMVNFMVNHPTETAEDIEMSKKLFKRMRPTRGFLCMTMPFPGTPIYDYAFKKGETINLDDYYKFSINGALVVNISDLPDKELERLFWRFHFLIERCCIINRLKLIINAAMNPRKLIKYFYRNYGVKMPVEIYEKNYTN